MSTGHCNCVKLRERVRILEEALADLVGYMADLVVTDELTEQTLEEALMSAKQALKQDSLGDGK